MAQDLTQWEYRRADAYSAKDFEELNKLGEQGWEVAAQNNSAGVVLKRPKQPQQQPSRPRDDDRYYGR